MKNLRKFKKLRKQIIKVAHTSFLNGEEFVYSYEDCLKLIDLKFDDKKKYVCFADYQGGSFAVNKCLTAKGWAEQALEWCDMDEHHSYICRLIDNCNEKKLIDEIQDFWSIGIRRLKRGEIVNA